MKVKIVEKSSFKVAGKKIWISGQNNEEFAEFWNEANGSGYVDRLRILNCSKEMEPAILGVSRVEKDPDNRTFYFYIACETEEREDDLETFTVPAAKWAVFSNHGDNLGKALFEAEMYCHMTWLKGSGYVHAKAPEMEVYPMRDGTLVEYWLPIE